MKALCLRASAVIFGCLAVSCRTLPPERRPVAPAPLQIELMGEITCPELSEISGIAPSQIQMNRLWVHNDSGNAPKLYAVGTNGVLQGSFQVGGVENRDWEDMASFQKDGVSWLVIGEIGDNHARHSSCRLIFIKEPGSVQGSFPEAVNPARVIEFQYEGGARDVEGLSVDPHAGKIYLLSKRTEPPVLYELPLGALEEQGLQTARRVTKVSGIDAPSLPIQMLAPVKGKFSSMPTAMDLSRDGRRTLIMTYRDLYLYVADSLRGGETPICKKDLPYLRQAEAACFSEDGNQVYFTSEKIPAPLYRIHLPE